MTPGNRPPAAAFAAGSNDTRGSKVTDDKTQTPDHEGAGRIDDETAEAIFETMAEQYGEVPPPLREAYGINADGSIADGGLTAEGRAHAELLGGIVAAFLGKQEARTRHAHRFALATAHSLGHGMALDPFGLRGPVRAALRAGAQAFAAALNDGETDDDGIDDDDAEVAEAIARDGEAFEQAPPEMAEAVTALLRQQFGPDVRVVDVRLTPDGRPAARVDPSSLRVDQKARVYGPTGRRPRPSAQGARADEFDETDFATAGNSGPGWFAPPAASSGPSTEWPGPVEPTPTPGESARSGESAAPAAPQCDTGNASPSPAPAPAGSSDGGNGSSGDSGAGGGGGE